MPAVEPTHLPPAVAAALERLGPGDAAAARDARPTAARGHNLVLAVPPLTVTLPEIELLGRVLSESIDEATKTGTL